MGLRELGNVWNRLGREDPYWAALTAQDKRHGRWSADEFFRLGLEEIDARLARAAELGWALRPGRALDFGCGAGRLTQAMAGRFGDADGVDIAPSMIALATRHNRHGDHCRYHVSGEQRLPFDDRSFDFVYSTLVIQHIPPPFSREYVRELVRVLAPGGLLVFQVPSHHGPSEPLRTAPTTVVTAALPASAFRADVVPDEVAVRAKAGEEFLVGVTVRNTSDQVWPCKGLENGLYQLQLGNHWRHKDGVLERENDGRLPLPHDVSPGQHVQLSLLVRAPDVNGEYDIELDLVQEHVAWFAEQASTTARITCTVDGGRLPERRRPQRRRLGQLFPRVHRALVELGVDHIRRRLGRALERLQAELRKPTMVMYCLPRPDVVDLVEAEGGRMLAIDQEPTADGFHSCRYWVIRL